MEPVPAQSYVGPDAEQWEQVSHRNTRVIMVRDINSLVHLVLLEKLKVGSGALEGKYSEQFIITIIPAIQEGKTA